MSRLALRLGLLLGVLAPLAGCSVYGLASSMGFGATEGRSTSEIATDRISVLSGHVQVPAALGGTKALAEMSPLTVVSPLLAVAPLAGVHLYAPSSIRSVQATSFGPEGVREALVEFVDLETGEVAATATTGQDGLYATRLVFKGTRHSYMAQTILRNARGQVVGFLAAPVGVDVSLPVGKRPSLDLSAGSTLVALSTTLLSDAYPTFDMTKGYAGIKSGRLAAMVGTIPPHRLQGAASLLDQSRTLNADSFDKLLSDAATASAVMTYEVRKLAQQATGAASITEEAPGVNAAILGQLVDRLASLTTPPSADSTQGFFEAVGKQVDLGQARTDGDQIKTALPSLPPLPSPTPAKGVEVVFE
ncbi:MAG TPA: hypothetical protein V6D00_14970 [Pantanalinema sp.]